jgi:lipid-binding SYLF domain-containing protein
MRSKTLILITSIALSFMAIDAGAASSDTEKADKERQKILKMRGEVLDRLYGESSSAKEIVDKSVGYAVFSNLGINVLLISTARGAGIAHDNESNQDTYMKMFSAGGGLGLGLKKFSAVFAFHTRDAFDQFVDKGWNFSGQADAAATTDGEEDKQLGAADGAAAINDGVTIYQMTDKGLALQVTLQGTKYWKDDDLH